MISSTDSPIKAIFGRGYRFILAGATIAGFQLFEVLLDIKKQGIDWLDHKSNFGWIWYMFGLILIGQDYLLRTTHNIPLSWQPPHMLRALCTGVAAGWILHLISWLAFGW